MWLPLLIACTAPDGGDDTDAQGPSERDQNLASASGDYAVDFVSAATYDRIAIEIDAVVGTAPDAETTERMVAVLEDLCDKPGGVTVDVDDDIPSQGSPTWSIAAAEEIESGYRDRYRDPDDGTAVIYALWLDGHSDRDTDATRVLGYAVHGSSLVMFAESIAAAEGGLLTAPVEPVVAAHELGHLLGLVNNGVPMVADHQDEARGAHDVDDGCIMYWAVETSHVVDLLLGGEPDFDDACRADLDAVR